MGEERRRRMRAEEIWRRWEFIQNTSKERKHRSLRMFIVLTFIFQEEYCIQLYKLEIWLTWIRLLHFVLWNCGCSILSPFLARMSVKVLQAWDKKMMDNLIHFFKEKIILGWDSYRYDSSAKLFHLARFTKLHRKQSLFSIFKKFERKNVKQIYVCVCEGNLRKAKWLNHRGKDTARSYPVKFSIKYDHLSRSIYDSLFVKLFDHKHFCIMP